MHKTSFLKRVVQKHQKPQITQRIYHQVLKDLLTSIQSELAAGRTVQFLGFGTFYLDERIEELEKEEGIPHPHKH